MILLLCKSKLPGGVMTPPYTLRSISLHRRNPVVGRGYDRAAG